MDIEFINSVAGLWPLLLTFCGFILLLVYRPQICDVINRFTKFQLKKGDAEFNVEQNPLPNKLGEDFIANPYQENLRVDLPITIPATEEDYVNNGNRNNSADFWIEMDSALSQNKYSEAEEIFNNIQKCETNPDKIIDNQAYFLFLKFSVGDKDALNELHALKDLNKANLNAFSVINFMIGICHEKVSQFKQAINFFNISIECSQDIDRKTNSIISKSRCLVGIGEKSTAKKLLEESIKKIENPKSLSALYVALANYYGKEGEKLLKAVMLEKSLEFEPNDISVLFETAYSYNEADINDLSLLHYKNLLTFSPDNPNGLNNIGVLYNLLEMPIRSVENYKKSWKNGNTLAAANLSSKYLQEGFSDEAKQLLAQAQKEDFVHQNIASAILDCSRKEEKENEIERKLLENSYQTQEFFRNFGLKISSLEIARLEINGYWFSENDLITITQRDGIIEGTWGVDENKGRFSGKIINNGIIIENEKFGYKFLLREKGFVKDSEAIGYFSDDFQTIYMMLIKDKSTDFLSYKRQNVNELIPAISSEFVPDKT
jgi:Tfp pilus assembly protein PilF